MILLFAALYLLGYVVTVLLACRHMAPVNAGDVGAALYFGACWPIIAPFAALAWLVWKALPLFGIEVKR